MLAFYDFPATHWQQIRTTNPIESVKELWQPHNDADDGLGKLMTTAQKRWRPLRGYQLPADVIEGVKFKDGERMEADKLSVR